MNRFLVKIYDISGTFKLTINPSDLKKDISFTANVGGGQGQINLSMNYDFNDSTIDNTDIAKVFLVNPDNKKGVLLYAGIAQNLIRKIDESTQEINLPCLGLGSVLSYILFKSGTNYSFTLTQDPAQTIKDIIDYFSTIYPGILSYTGASIDSYGASVGIDFANENCLSALNKAVGVTDFKVYVKQDGVVYFKPKPATSTHSLTMGKDVENLSIEENSEDLVNKLILKYGGGTSTYQDVTSQTNYGVREIYLDKSSELPNIADANEFGNNYISENKDPKKKTIIVVNKNYEVELGKTWDSIEDTWDTATYSWDSTIGTFGIEGINPGETIKVKNINFSIDNLQIIKLNYNTDRVTLELEDVNSLAQTIFNP